jgi:hypothetical protein
VMSRLPIMGALSQYRAGFTQKLAARGYTPLSAARQAQRLAKLSRWLVEQQLSVSELTREHIETFLT